ncbi:DUF4181 domain-containing protein [Bacillus salacetis]|uniref:DUF4181 domain-containing protein n=1 Tax=Bacillus salacetis TaxID=2315464 RepID=UPI003BA18D99
MGSFFLKMILVMSAVGLFIFLINTVLRKWLNVERKPLFSYNHINEKHKKTDWIIRISSVVLIFAGFIINVSLAPSEQIWFLQTHYILFGFIIASETARAVYEKKYLPDQNDYLFTTIQMVFVTALLLTAFMTDFYGFI